MPSFPLQRQQRCESCRTEMVQIIHSLSSEVFAFEICPEDLNNAEDVPLLCEPPFIICKPAARTCRRGIMVQAALMEESPSPPRDSRRCHGGRMSGRRAREAGPGTQGEGPGDPKRAYQGRGSLQKGHSRSLRRYLPAGSWISRRLKRKFPDIFRSVARQK